MSLRTFSPVEMVVGESDQRVVATAVVHVQAALADGAADLAGEYVQDALTTDERAVGLVTVVVGIVLVIESAAEEGRRRELLLVADDDRLRGPQQGRHGILGEDLRRLVEDDGVELDRLAGQSSPRKVLAHG